jgi:hypothetical protein
MSRSLAYVLSIISIILVGSIIAAKYFGIHIPVLGKIIAGNMFEITLISYFMLFIPAVWRN